MINNRFDDFFTKVAGKYDLPLIDSKAKALIAIAINLTNGSDQGSSSFLSAIINQSFRLGVTHREIQELLLLLCVYIGFNRMASSFGTLNKILKQHGSEDMMSAIKQENYAMRDRLGKAAFYVLLWKRKGIDRELFYDYWKNVHGPLCARLPSQYQYWQLHLDRNRGGIWHQFSGIEYICPDAEQFDGIAELTFETEDARQSFFDSSKILMADEHNLFSKAIGYNTAIGNSITYIDHLPIGDPNGKVEGVKFHILIQQADSVSLTEFRQYMSETLARTLAQSNLVLKLRLHLFEAVDNSRPDASEVSHFEPPEQQYQAAIEIAFANPLEMEKFFASKEYAVATKDLAQYVKKFYPFPERSVYTFVYDGKITLAGQRSSQVADLILQAGATNQLKKELVSSLNGTESPSGKISNSGLGHYLQGVQHFGVTVRDMAQSVEFYTEVLGGQLVVSESELVGDTVQNTLFQKEELDVIASGIALENADLPQLRSSKDDALDVKFISFGNVVVELLHVREAGRPNPHQSSVDSLPSHIGRVNAMHLSFNVKEGIDLNQFAQMLEEECHRRGMSEVVFNRIVRVNSIAERKAVAIKYNSFKFWNEAEETVDWSKDPMEGWSLFYCKGPNGEQLEFNQVTRSVKWRFQQGVQNYNQTNNTAFIFPDFRVKDSYNDNGLQLETSDRLYFTYSLPVDAPLDIVWDIVVDKIENTSRYNPEAQDPQIIKRYSDGMLRQMSALGMTVKERIVLNRSAGTITHTLLDNPFFVGQIVNQIVYSATKNPNEQLTIRYTLNWKPINDRGKKMAAKIRQQLQQAVRHAVISAKEVAEQQNISKKSLTQTKRKSPMSTQFPGKNTDLVKRLFSRGEAFDAEGFVTFFTDTPLYQFGNFEVCLDKESIKQSAYNFFSKISAVYHEIKMIWELGDVVFVEMDVLYWRKDGSMVSLPCFDIFRVEEDKFSELRIFMDVNPLFNPSIIVPKSASVLTHSQGKLMAPGTMKKHYAQHSEGQQRVADGFIPKWSIAGPKWSIAPINKVDLVMKMEQAGGEFKWDYFQTFFTDDVLFKVGASEEGRGWKTIADYLTWLYAIAEPQLPFTFRGTWDLPDTVIIEMDAKYIRRSDGKPVSFPCTDILRFDENNKVNEWRVYPDQSELWMEHLKPQAK